MNLSYITAIQGNGANLSEDQVPEGYYTLKEYCRTSGVSKQKIRYALNMGRVEPRFFIKDGYNYFIRKDFEYTPPTVDAPSGYLNLTEYCEKYNIERYTIYYALYHNRIANRHYVKKGRNYFLLRDYNYREDRIDVPDGFLTVADYCKKYGKKRSSVYYYLRINRIPENAYIIRHSNYYIREDYEM